MALIVVLVLISILGMLFGIGGREDGLSLATAGQSTERNMAYFVAQGALQRALTELRDDPNWTGVTGADFPGGVNQTYDVQLFSNTTGAPKATPAGVKIAPGTTLVLATGHIGDTSHKMAGILTSAGSDSPGFACLTQGDFYLSGARIGAFDAPNGSFAIADLNFQEGMAQIGSLNSVIEIKTQAADPDAGTPARPTIVDGSIASDQLDGSVETQDPGVYVMDPDSVIGGEKRLDAPPTLSFDPIPTYLGGPDISESAGVRTLLPGHYNSLNLTNDAYLHLEPGDYYFKDLFRTFDTSRIYTKGKVRIFVGGRCATNGTSSLNHEGDPRNCELIMTKDGSTVSDGTAGWMSQESYAWARIKVPRGKLGVSGTIYGDVQADSVKVTGDPDDSGAINFFTDLAEPGGGPLDGVGGTFIYSSTWTVQ